MDFIVEVSARHVHLTQEHVVLDSLDCNKDLENTYWIIQASMAAIQNKDERRNFRNAPKFVPGGQSTQLIVGASPESDLKILTLSEN